MSTLRLDHETGRAVRLCWGDALLARYVYAPEVELKESPKPYFHPLNSLAGDTLTNFRPNDHPWHHGLCFTLNQVSGANFWGGPTCLRPDGYKWRDDHGVQQHVAWTRLEAAGATATLAHTLEWRRLAETLLRETRTLGVTVDAAARTWALHWQGRITNVSGRTLKLGNPHSGGGLAGSHYTGLQFRGARELLDDHLDPTIKVVAEGGLEGIPAVHGAAARWMEWHGQLDGTLHRVIIRFENHPGPLHWFVRRNYPLAALPVQFDQELPLAPGAELVIDHTLTFRSP
ncbi:MAG TPA: PmoA family protein [Opitutaceae bacterium]|nr:PmoA family protein [Opitutaceae bacterium]